MMRLSSIFIALALACAIPGAVLAQSDTALQFRHATLLAADADAVSAWYVDKLGFTLRRKYELLRWDNSKVEVVEVMLGPLIVNITKRPGVITKEKDKEYFGWRHLAFAVRDVDKAYESLSARGVQFVVKPASPKGTVNLKVAHLVDPEGNVLEIYQDLP